MTETIATATLTRTAATPISPVALTLHTAYMAATLYNIGDERQSPDIQNMLEAIDCIAEAHGLAREHAGARRSFVEHLCAGIDHRWEGLLTEEDLDPNLNRSYTHTEMDGILAAFDAAINAAHTAQQTDCLKQYKRYLLDFWSHELREGA